MKLQNLSSSDLLSYSTILENIIHSNLEVQREISEAVSAEFCTKEEIDKIYNKSLDARTEADQVYSEIQKELDMRVKRDLGMKFGIRRSQSIIKELDAFAHNKNLERAAEHKKQVVDQLETNMEIVKDDNSVQ